jgi:hypothetical protein
MIWTRIQTQSEADELMRQFGSFHDGVLREAHLWTEHWVSDKLAMAIGIGLDTRVRMILQRQWQPLSAVELLFEEVTRFNVVPSPENYEASIRAATLLVAGATIFWADESNWRPGESDSDDVTWISARRLHWRDASDWMGEPLHFGSVGSLPPSDT